MLGDPSQALAAGSVGTLASLETASVSWVGGGLTSAPTAQSKAWPHISPFVIFEGGAATH